MDAGTVSLRLKRRWALRPVAAWWHHQMRRWAAQDAAAARFTNSISGAPMPTSYATPAASPSVVVPWPWSCINQREESGRWDTWSGGLGFVYPPSAYGGVAIQLAATYGDSWPPWPAWAQIQVAEQIVRESGYSAWTTAAACGL